jgi:DNA-binding response OmpR family regulator
MDTLILLIDQDRELLTILKLALECKGFSVITARDGREGIRTAYQNHPQAIILDVMMDNSEGWTTCQRLRQVCDTPILILSATAREEDIVKGLSLGADDYLTKPCDFGELGARIRAHIRRSSHARDHEHRIYDDGSLRVDLESGTVARRGKTVHLTPTETSLLMHLVGQRGRIVPHSELMVQVWGPEYATEISYLGVYIRYLRRKLEDDPARPRYIRSRYSIGYYFAGKNT